VADGPTLLFDLNGTLTDPEALGAPWGAAGLGEAVLRTAICSAMAETLFGSYHEFRYHIEDALRIEVGKRKLSAAGIDDALALAQRLPPFADVRPGLERLKAAGSSLAVLTNSGAASGRRTLEAAGLKGFFDPIVGVDAVRMFKPHADVYRHALDALGADDPESVLMVAAHPWDLSGAKHVGLRTALVSRHGDDMPSVFPQPDIIVGDLAELADRVEPRAP
jgi:2-haloacid dehalogenase